MIKHRNKKRQQNQQSCNITPVPVTEPDDDWTPEQEKAAAADYSRDLENNRANAAALVGAAIEAARKFKEIIEDDGVLTLQMKSQIFRAYDAWDEINAIVGSLGRMVNFHRPREAREELEREESESS